MGTEGERERRDGMGGDGIAREGNEKRKEIKGKGMQVKQKGKHRERKKKHPKGKHRKRETKSGKAKPRTGGQRQEETIRKKATGGER